MSLQGSLGGQTMSMQALGKPPVRGVRGGHSPGGGGFPCSSSAILGSQDPWLKFNESSLSEVPGRASLTAPASGMPEGDVMGTATVTGTVMGTAATMGSQRWVSGRWAGVSPGTARPLTPARNCKRGIAAELTMGGFRK